MQTTTRRFIFGEFVKDDAPITLLQVESLCDKSEVVRDELQSYPFDKVCRVMRRLSQAWKNPEYPQRKKALEMLPVESGYAESMIIKGLDVMAGLLDPDFLQQKIDTELRKIPVMEGFQFDVRTGTAKQWQPLGVVLHVLAGNVFTGGVGSWIEGVLTRNVTILKMSSSERVFMPLFISSLLECDPDGVLSRATALIDYSSSQTDVMNCLKQRVDGVVVWGGEQAVRAYREDLPARTRLVLFGPKLSLSVITKGGIDERSLEVMAKDLAQEMSIWDQNACTAPQICYIEGRDNAYKMGKLLAQNLALVEKDIPAGSIDLNSAVEIRKLRSLYEVNQLFGKSGFWSSGEDLRWSVFVDEDVELQPSPLHRTIRVIPFEDIASVVNQVKSYRGYVQTVGLESGSDERLHLAGKLAKFGVIRCVGLGQMAGGEIDDPHDGAYDLPQLLNLVLLRSNQPRDRNLDPIDRMLEEDRRKILDSYFRTLLDRARNSAYFAPIISNVENKLNRPIDGIADLTHFPVLSRELMEANMPPASQGLNTLVDRYAGGYVSRSGGSTGAPKFSIYDGHDWEQMISRAERLLLAAGLSKGDRLANCMIAGDLYGSFVSFDHIVSRLGVTSFAFSTKIIPAMFVDVWRNFNLNAIQGVPAFIIPLLRDAKKLEPNLSLEKFIFAGQALSQRDHKWLENELKVSCISSIIGANDGGQIAFQCQYLSGSEHHVTDDFNYIEIVDDQGVSIAEGERGRILITSLHKYAFPLIRYAIGDAARFVDKKCECGRTNRIIEYLGRCDSMVSVGFINLDLKSIEIALAEFSLSVIQLVAREHESGLEYLVLRLESPDIKEVADQKILSVLLTHIPVLKDRIAERKLLKIEIEKYSEGELPRDSRSAKVKSFLDER